MRILIFSIVLLFSTAALAVDTFFNWSVGYDGDYTYAATANEARPEEAFGEWCYYKSTKCLWLFSIETGCTENQKYTVLINSNTAADPYEVICLGKLPTGGSAYVFSNWKELERVVKDTGNEMIAIAYPLGGTKIGVSRFSLRGLKASTTAMEGQFLKRLHAGDSDHGKASPAAEVL